MIRDAVLAGLLPEQLLETRLSELIETATSTYLTMRSKRQHGCSSRKPHRQRTSLRNTLSRGSKAPESLARPLHPWDIPASPLSDDMDFSVPRKSRLSGPQLQAQLSRLTVWTRLRRLKDTLLSKGAWQQVTRIEDLCHAQVSREWLYHLDACAGSVLTPHDHITNVQKKRLGYWLWGVTGSVGAAPLSWTLSWSMQKPAAPLKPREDTTLVFTLWSAA